MYFHGHSIRVLIAIDKYFVVERPKERSQQDMRKCPFLFLFHIYKYIMEIEDGSRLNLNLYFDYLWLRYSFIN